jgi:hypothetical protein
MLKNRFFGCCLFIIFLILGGQDLAAVNNDLGTIDSILQNGPEFKKGGAVRDMLSIPDLDTVRAISILLNALEREVENQSKKAQSINAFLPPQEGKLNHFTLPLIRLGLHTKEAIYKIREQRNISSEFEARLNFILGNLKDVNVHDEVLGIFRSSQNPFTRALALQTLANYRDTLDIQVFREALNDSFYYDPYGLVTEHQNEDYFPVRLAATNGLAVLGYKTTKDGNNFQVSKIEPQIKKYRITPQFKQYPFLLDKSFFEFEMDFTKPWNDSMALLFMYPQDAIILHVLISGEPKDVFVISDIGLNRLMFIQCVEENKSRRMENITIFSGDEKSLFKGVSGLATTAVGRLFDPESDEILVAERWGNRVAVLSYFPDADGGVINIERTVGEQYLHSPMEIALTDYGTGSANLADLFIIENGAGENKGALYRFGIHGDYKGRWDNISMPGVKEPMWYWDQPSGLACYYNTLLSKPVLCLTEKTSNSVFFMSITQTGEPVWEWSYTLEIDGPYLDPGGMAIDDLGRIFIANKPLGQIEMFNSRFEPLSPPFGKMKSGVERFSRPTNILIDTYHGYREALIIENSGSHSGFQSFIIDEANPPLEGAKAMGNMILPKKYISHKTELPRSFSLSDPRPNPFNDKCIIEFVIPEEEQVNIELYDVLGRRVTTILNEYCNPGKRSIVFQAQGLSSGIYFYRMKAGKYSSEKSMLLLK